MSPDSRSRAHNPGGAAGRWFDGLGDLCRAVEATNKAGGPVPFEEAIESVIKAAFGTHARGGKLIWVGNGGSASIASHMAADYLKNGGIRSMTFSDPSLLTCVSNDYGYEHVYAKPIEALAQRGDLLVAISSSGRSANILNAVAAARAADVGVVTLSGFDADNPLRALGDLNFYVPSRAYGFVEIIHLCLCHAVLDISMETGGTRA